MMGFVTRRMRRCTCYRLGPLMVVVVAVVAMIPACPLLLEWLELVLPGPLWPLWLEPV